MKKVLNGVFLQMLISNNSLDMNVETFAMKDNATSPAN